jgi:dihydropteroate synthase
MRILSITQEKDLRQLMRRMNVDAYGIKIMLPKAQSFLLKVNALSNIAANILKQEMLSLGGDVAVSRGALTGKARKTDCLIMGSLAQLRSLSNKLTKQPFGLNNLARDLVLALKNYRRQKLSLDLGRYRLNLGARSHIMGIVNTSPDSFSADGICGKWEAVEYAEKLIREGADIIDVGGESSRPGARPVPLKVELARTIPVVKALVKKIKAPVSIDTCKTEVARQALDNGASLVNDITGLRDIKTAKIISRYKAGAVIMHMRGNPRSMQENPQYESLIDEISAYLAEALDRGIACGIAKEKIIIDPGIGFGKTPEHNLKILRRLKEFKVFGLPILVGTSRKAFIGKILNVPAAERVFGTVASCVVACENGANIVRVHDVKAVKQALLIKDRIGE